ncbi:hypothetical protein KY337_05195 [Candidatus Woesearchaeota archaeon]|nr:hypothetical protein [Candidatus Woesearchaeota archaeon]
MSDIIKQERRYQSKARSARNKHGRCPAQREFMNKTYCSREIACQEYGGGLIAVREEGELKLMYRCRFVETFNYVRRS